MSFNNYNCNKENMDKTESHLVWDLLECQHLGIVFLGHRVNHIPESEAGVALPLKGVDGPIAN